MSYPISIFRWIHNFKLNSEMLLLNNSTHPRMAHYLAKLSWMDLKFKTNRSLALSDWAPVKCKMNVNLWLKHWIHCLCTLCVCGNDSDKIGLLHDLCERNADMCVWTVHASRAFIEFRFSRFWLKRGIISHRPFIPPDFFCTKML